MLAYIKKQIKNVFYSYGGNNISNISVNYLFSPIYFAIVFYALKKYFNFPDYIEGSLLAGTVPLSIISTVFYLYASTFFQPDLDAAKFRPGFYSFPFGSSIKHIVFKIGKRKINLGSTIRDLAKPVTWIWYWMWHPFAMLFTHRGAGHWPIVGVWLRVGWLYLWMLFFEGLLRFFDIRPPEFDLIYAWMRAFFPGQKGFMTVGFFLFCFPVYLGDIFHSLVDLMEAMKKGVSFCSPMQRRGLLIKLWKTIIIIPGIVWNHIKDLNN